jgi:hypothetical protein
MLSDEGFITIALMTGIIPKVYLLRRVHGSVSFAKCVRPKFALASNMRTNASGNLDAFAGDQVALWKRSRYSGCKWPKFGLE